MTPILATYLVKITLRGPEPPDDDSPPWTPGPALSIAELTDVIEDALEDALGIEDALGGEHVVRVTAERTDI